MWPNVHATASPKVTSQLLLVKIVEPPDGGMVSPPTGPGPGAAPSPGAGVGAGDMEAPSEGSDAEGAGVVSLPLAVQQVEANNGAAKEQVVESNLDSNSEHVKENCSTVATASGLTKGPLQISQEPSVAF